MEQIIPFSEPLAGGVLPPSSSDLSAERKGTEDELGSADIAEAWSRADNSSTVLLGDIGSFNAK